MSFLLQRFGPSVEITAEREGLNIRRTVGDLDLSRRENWPAESLSALGAWRTAIEIEQLLELGLAEVIGHQVVVPYGNFQTIESDMPVGLDKTGTQPSPFLLKIDRQSDIGRNDFQYKYQFLLGGRPVYLDRMGYYVRRAGRGEIFLLDHQMYGLAARGNSQSRARMAHQRRFEGYSNLQPPTSDAL